MNSIRANKTWDLVELPKNRHALPCKWVYRLKEMFDSTNPKSKLVAKGFRQEYGVDFDEIFSLVVKMTTLHLMLGVPINLRLSQQDFPASGPEGEDMKSVPYAPAVSSLMYVMVVTRPDISHAVGVVIRLMHNLGEEIYSR